MLKPLHVTNGDAAAERIRAAVDGDVLPWRDALHEGPVKSGLSLQELSDLRARFVAAAGWEESFERAIARFRARDGKLAAFRRHSSVTLWFEHDLYDQLQLLQLLAWFSRRPAGAVPLALICIDGYPGVAHFRGLGQLTVEQLAELHGRRREVESLQLELGARVWDAFGAETPLSWMALLDQDLAPLPFLREAVLRHLEEYPWTRDGLSRSERQLLAVLRDGERGVRDAYEASQIAPEPRVFMADVPFLLQVRRLAALPHPLVEAADPSILTVPAPEAPDGAWRSPLRITEAGRRVLAGEVDRTRFNRVERWLGGVRLEGASPVWRWDPGRHRVVRQTA